MKKETEDPRDKRISIRFNTNEYAWVQEEASRRGVSLGEQIRFVLSVYRESSLFLLPLDNNTPGS